MGFQVPVNTPTFTVDGAKYCIAVFSEGTPFGKIVNGRLYVERVDGWNACDFPIAEYLNAGELLADVKAKGGIVKYLEWLKSQFASLLARYFTKPVVVSGEPTTDDEALIAIQAAMKAWVITVTNGIPKVA